MDTKHTPGPWMVRFMNEDLPEDGFFVEAKNNNMPELGYGIEIMMEDFGEHNGYPFHQRLADAILISQSPDLLEALATSQQIIRSLIAGQRVVNLDEALAYNDSLIKKATS